MDKFQALEPVKLYTTLASSLPTSLTSRNASAKTKPAPQFLGRLPVDLHILILSHLPVPDVPSYAASSRGLNKLVKDPEGLVWRCKWLALGVERLGLGQVLDELEAKQKVEKQGARDAAPPTLPVDDEFGDFEQADVLSPPQDEMGDFVGAFDSSMNFGAPVHPQPAHVLFDTPAPIPAKDTSRAKYIRAHTLLKPLVKLLDAPPHTILSQLADAVAPTTSTSTSISPLLLEGQALRLLSRFLSSRVKSVRRWDELTASLRTAMDRFDANMLAAFDHADSRGDEEGMKESAWASWIVWEGAERSEDPSHVPSVASSTSVSAGELYGGLGGGVKSGWDTGGGGGPEWELGKVWAEKREIFYESGRWDALQNFKGDGTLSFDAMDSFMEWVTSHILEHGARAVRVFPKEAGVLEAFGGRVGSEVVGEYVSSLLARAREISTDIYLKSVAASFRESWRIVDAILQCWGLNPDADEAHKESASKTEDERKEEERMRKAAEAVVYRMFEGNMDEYLDEEVETVKLTFETILKGWDRSYDPTTHNGPPSPSHQTRFLASQNPAQVKRNVLGAFTNLLLLPVTIVPRTVNAVGGAIVAGGTAVGGALVAGGSAVGGAAVQGIGMLNPARWGGAGTQDGGYTKNFSNSGSLLADGDDDDAFSSRKEKQTVSLSQFEALSPTPLISANGGPTQPMSAASTATANGEDTAQLDLLLSLDVALELIHADREAVKRVEIFGGYPGVVGTRVRDTIEELFILFLNALGEGHLRSGFGKATERMKSYKPDEHTSTANVAPLEQFFELVHMGDTIQSMVQVYFEKELAPHIDKTDFLNAVVREKKRFENSLDDSVAAGLNAGTEVLMNQVDHIITTRTKPREYYPPEDSLMDLKPTHACQEAIQCLEVHCKLLKGSTSKEVLEVFYQEVGIRLIAILQKHIKRQIISLNGGFQVIADLNAYNEFIASLKVPSIIADFSNLRMLGHVYVVEDAKDLAQIVRDVTRYGGAYRPEDIYEYLQRRSDWKKIEKTVDKTMYNLSFKEDCNIM